MLNYLTTLFWRKNVKVSPRVWRSGKVGGFYTEHQRFEFQRQLEGNIFVGTQLSCGDKIMVRVVVPLGVLFTCRKGKVYREKNRIPNVRSKYV